MAAAAVLYTCSNAYNTCAYPCMQLQMHVQAQHPRITMAVPSAPVDGCRICAPRLLKQPLLKCPLTFSPKHAAEKHDIAPNRIRRVAHTPTHLLMAAAAALHACLKQPLSRCPLIFSSSPASHAKPGCRSPDTTPLDHSWPSAAKAGSDSLLALKRAPRDV